MKSRSMKTIEVIERASQKSIRMFGKKENYKYLGILEAGTIKWIEIEEKKRTPQNNNKTSWNQDLQEKGKTPGQSSL